MGTKINVINLGYIDEYLLDQNTSPILVEQARSLLADFTNWYGRLDKVSDINKRSTNVYTSAIFFSFLNCMVTTENNQVITILRRSIKDTQYKTYVEDIEE